MKAKVAAALAAIAVAVVGGLLVVRATSDEGSSVWERADDGPPFAVSHGVWRGDRLIVTGPGATTSWERGKGWSPAAPLPFSGTDGVRLVATRDHVVAYDGGEAALLGASGAWRSVPATTVPRPRRALAVVWTGEEVLVWGELRRDIESNVGVALDPATGAWRPLPAAPMGLNRGNAVWDGEEMIVVGSHLDNANRADGPAGTVAIAYAPTTNTWRQLADPRLSPQATSVAWTGSTLVAWDYLLRASRYEVVTDSWSPYPEIPLDEAECVPQSGVLDEAHVFLHYCEEAAVLDVRSGSAEPIALPAAPFEGIAIAATGRVALFTGHRGDGLWILREDGR